MTEPFRGDGPGLVALGGGHGLAVALRALRRLSRDVTAVVSVADDGGSSGRLRRDLDVPAPGDLRKALVALAPEGVWPDALEHRFASGELAGHALGNLLIAGLTEALGSLPGAVAEVGRLVGATGRVLPATLDPVVIEAEVRGRRIAGQTAIAGAGGDGRIRDVRIRPPDAQACAEAVAAVGSADLVVLAPGSLFTSVIAALCVPELRAAVASCGGRVVQVANLQTERPESEGLDGTDHLLAVLEQGARVDAFLYDPGTGLPVDADRVRAAGVAPVAADVAAPDGFVHDPDKLASALSALL